MEDFTEQFTAFFKIGYFNWWLVCGYIVLVGVFLFGILRPTRNREWKSAGAAQAWVIALYAEMYGTPLTAYLVMGFLGRSQRDAENHFNGHLWPVILGFSEQTVQHAQFWFTVVGQVLVLIGAVLAVIGWRQLHSAVKEDQLACNGLYRYIRHPQYTGFFLFLIGSMINWPTLATLLTLPMLLWVYWRLARREEGLAIEQFGDRYREYMSRTGRFLPGIGRVRFQPVS
ncbi:MAG: isoprenylcysteine carboxylmethyltransferase family protein [Planctomycetota bacterium]